MFWSLLVPVIVALIGTSALIITTYIPSKSKTIYKIPEKDQLEINKLSAQIKALEEKYFMTDDPVEKAKLDAELHVLAKAEADIMSKYNSNYEPRWPIIIKPGLPSTAISFPILGFIILYIIARLIVRRILKEKYNVTAETGEIEPTISIKPKN